MERERWVHVEWLGYAQPVGLVVTPAALVGAQCAPDSNVAGAQEELRAIVGEQLQIADLKEFLLTYLGWRESDLRGPETETVYLEEYKETLAPDLVAVGESGSVALLKQVPNGVDLDALPPDDAPGWSATEQTRFERLLRETKTPVGVLSNGHVLRLVYAPRGESAGHLTFPVAAMTEVGGRPLLSAMRMLLHADRLFAVAPEQRLPAILASSRKYQGEVSNRLSEQVLEALHLLLRGMEAADAAAKGRLLQEYRREHRGELSDGLLTVILRLVFLLYAEDKGLMPASPVYLSSYSLTGLYKDLRDDEARFPDLMDQRFGAWARLLTLFRLVFRGGGHGDFSLPKRHGELFDPDAFPFLEGRPRGDHFSADKSTKLESLPRLSDGVVLGVLARLLVLDGERLSYRALDVEQIGSVYESMMGFELEAAEGRSVALRPKHVVVNLDALLDLAPKKRLEQLKDAECDVSGNTAKAVSSAETLDELLAALSRRLSPFTQQPLPAGSLYLQPGKERRRSGSHYTPRSLTEPIVEKTLAPMLRGLGPNPLPRDIQSLKVCDPAMGSGAFLVEACRYLGERLKESWLFHRLAPKVPEDEDLTLHARRVVAQKCLYGVDKNPMAVQLAKLSLWLFTLAKDHPFTFLDHALKCGDSLVGLNRDQITRFNWDVDEEAVSLVFRSYVDQLVQRGEVLRLQIHDLPDPPDTAELKVLHEAAEASLHTARLLGHLVVAAFFLGGSARKKQDRLKELVVKVRQAWDATVRDQKLLEGQNVHAAPDALGPLNHALQVLLDSLREQDPSVPARPFHWELEFPEVFGRGRDGFDSFIGNPPFSGKNGISEAGGEQYIPWLQTMHEGAHGNADLSAHFFRRAFDMLIAHGTFGLIATNTIAQGDTRATGLKHLVANGGVIYDATRSMMWPGNAAVAVSVVHLAKGRDRDSLRDKRLDGKPAADINSRLRAKPERPDPVPLKANADLSFQGTIVLGMGFVLTPEERDAYIRKDERNAERIFPYIGGEEVNTSPTQDFNRYVICFADLPKKAGEKFRAMAEDEAKRWPDLYKRVEELVKPERMKLGDNADARKRKSSWWLYGRDTPALYEALAGQANCLVNSIVTKHLAFSLQPVGRVFSHRAQVCTLERFGALGVLQSRVHEGWARLLSSTMKQDLNYSGSDSFENFPFPKADPRAIIPALEAVGERLYTARAKYMKAANQGLTQAYNKLKDPDCDDAEIVALRELHLELDRAVLDAYGWSSIEVPPYTRPETDEERARLEAFEDEVLDKVFALNAERAAFEALEAAKPPSGAGGKPKKQRPARKPKQKSMDFKG